MRFQKLFSVATLLAVLLAAAPKQPSAITVTCVDGGTAPACNLGQVNFTASGYPHDLEIVQDGISLGGYVSFQGGEVDFTLSYSSLEAGAHTIQIVDGGGKNAGGILGSVDFTVN